MHHGTESNCYMILQVIEHEHKHRTLRLYQDKYCKMLKIYNILLNADTNALQVDFKLMIDGKGITSEISLIMEDLRPSSLEKFTIVNYKILSLPSVMLTCNFTL